MSVTGLGHYVSDRLEPDSDHSLSLSPRTTLATSVPGVFEIFPSALFMDSLVFGPNALPFLLGGLNALSSFHFSSAKALSVHGVTRGSGLRETSISLSSSFSCLHRFLPLDVVAPEEKGTGTRPLVTQLVLVSDPKASVLQGAVCLMKLAVRTRRHLWASCGDAPRPRRWPLLWMKEAAVPSARRPPAPSGALPVALNSWQRSVGLEASIFTCLGCLPVHF